MKRLSTKNIKLYSIVKNRADTIEMFIDADESIIQKRLKEIEASDPFKYKVFIKGLEIARCSKDSMDLNYDVIETINFRKVRNFDYFINHQSIKDIRARIENWNRDDDKYFYFIKYIEFKQKKHINTYNIYSKHITILSIEDRQKALKRKISAYKAHITRLTNQDKARLFSLNDSKINTLKEKISKAKKLGYEHIAKYSTSNREEIEYIEQII